MKTVGFFNVKGGMGTTTLVYHLAWMFQEIGIGTVAIDLDPQADLTAAFLPEQRLEEVHEKGATIFGTLESLLQDKGSIREPALEEIAGGLVLLPGSVQLSLYEERFSQAWPRYAKDESNDNHEALFILTSFRQIAQSAAEKRSAPLVLIDVGPGVGALQRAALVACDFVVTPLSTHLASFQSLPTLGPSFRKWRSSWREHGAMTPIGYVVLHRAFVREWHTRLVEELSKLYHREILGEPDSASVSEPDPYRLTSLKQYRGLMILAQAAHKPIFLLKPADGAIGSQAEAVLDCYRDYKQLALRIASAIGIDPNAS